MKKPQMVEFRVLKSFLLKGGWSFEPLVQFIEVIYPDGSKYGWNISHSTKKYLPSKFEFDSLMEAEAHFKMYTSYFLYGDESRLEKSPYGIIS